MADVWVRLWCKVWQHRDVLEAEHALQPEDQAALVLPVLRQVHTLCVGARLQLSEASELQHVLQGVTNQELRSAIEGALGI